MALRQAELSRLGGRFLCSVGEGHLATDLALHFKDVKRELSESETARALLAQHPAVRESYLVVADDICVGSSRCRACLRRSASDGDKRRERFLEETVEQKDRFVEARAQRSSTARTSVCGCCCHLSLEALTALALECVGRLVFVPGARHGAFFCGAREPPFQT